MTKAELRKQFKEKRLRLSAEEVETRSRQICKLFFEHFNLSQTQYLHIFLPITRLKEVNTYLFIKQIQDVYPGLKIVLPKTDADTFSMDSILYDTESVLTENSWGITEPVKGEHILPEQIDIILLPLLGFDTAGFRVGYGKGYYDRFLARCRTDVIKTGLALEDPVPQIEDINGFDIRMDYCITPQKIWHFGRNVMGHSK